MAGSNFIDYVKIFCRSGAGGAGSAHFLRGKGLPQGGPDGGDGGRGGDIILKGNGQLWTLLHLKYSKHIHATDGAGGAENRKSGADGESRIIEVPLGTIVRNAETGEVIAEIQTEEEEVTIMAGGRGGLGNDHFKTSTNQAPQYAQPGESGTEGWIILELKLLADIGLVGFPNAGKSTLLASVSAAKPEIADYPFTTLVPNLGVVAYRDYKSFVMADIPGIIEGAAEGKGLGLRFLRHIERNAILLFLVPADAPHIGEAYEVLLGELRKYNPELLDKKRLLAISKCDLLGNDPDLLIELVKQAPAELKPVCISAVTGFGIPELKDRIWKEIH